MTSIVVFGDVNVDVVSRLAGEINVESDANVTTRIAIGGSPCNMAAWIAHAGHQVSLLSAVADDDLGVWIRNKLNHAGIATTHVQTVAGDHTGTCVIMVDAHGKRTMFPDFGANLRIAITQPFVERIKQADVLVLSAYTFLRPETAQQAKDAVALARGSGTCVVIDAASSAPILATGPALVREFLESADILFANDDEVAALTSDGATDWLGTRSNLIIKHGPGGASWWSRGLLVAQVPAPAVTVVDTTGAGDALCAGVVGALRSEGSWFDIPVEIKFNALRLAVDLASRCCIQLGAWPR